MGSRRVFVVGQAVQRVDQLVDFHLVIAGVRRRVGGIGDQNTDNGFDDSLLLFWLKLALYGRGEVMDPW